VLLATLALAIGLLGHAAFWIALTNRLRATGVPRWLMKIVAFVTETIVVGTLLADRPA
jgi:hypothetical protein